MGKCNSLNENFSFLYRILCKIKWLNMLIWCYISVYTPDIICLQYRSIIYFPKDLCIDWKLFLKSQKQTVWHKSFFRCKLFNSLNNKSTSFRRHIVRTTWTRLAVALEGNNNVTEIQSKRLYHYNFKSCIICYPFPSLIKP